MQEPPDQASGWVTALDATNGKIKWQYHAPAPVVSGITPTAGGVVFGGDTKGNFFALDSDSGKPVFTMPTDGMIAGGVVTYAIDGQQYVAFTSGNVSRITFGALGDPTLIVLALDKESSNKGSSPGDSSTKCSATKPCKRIDGCQIDPVAAHAGPLPSTVFTRRNLHQA